MVWQYQASATAIISHFILLWREELVPARFQGDFFFVLMPGSGFFFLEKRGGPRFSFAVAPVDWVCWHIKHNALEKPILSLLQFFYLLPHKLIRVSRYTSFYIPMTIALCYLNNISQFIAKSWQRKLYSELQLYTCIVISSETLLPKSFRPFSVFPKYLVSLSRHVRSKNIGTKITLLT